VTAAILRAAGIAAAGAAALVSAAASGERSLVLLAAGLTALAFLALSLSANLRASSAPPSIAAAQEAAVLNAGLMAAVYAWGAVSIAGMYYLTDLSWYHAYQYALYLAVPSVLSALYSWRVETIDVTGRERPLRGGVALARVQAVAMAVVVGMLVASGKAPGVRPDWAANTVFMAGAAALLVISVLALVAQRKLRP
jgi:hypothetical protein